MELRRVKVPAVGSDVCTEQIGSMKKLSLALISWTESTDLIEAVEIGLDFFILLVSEYDGMCTFLQQ